MDIGFWYIVIYLQRYYTNWKNQSQKFIHCPDWCGSEGWASCCKLTGLIPGQGTSLGCGPGPGLGECERQLIDVSLVYQCFSPTLSRSGCWQKSFVALTECPGFLLAVGWRPASDSRDSPQFPTTWPFLRQLHTIVCFFRASRVSLAPVG